jgi:beta-glucosidase
MKKLIIAGFIVLGTLFSGFCTYIGSVKVDGVRGYDKILVPGNPGETCYMGKITYTFRAEGKDSVFVDFGISRQGGTDTIVVIEKAGDVGVVRQANAADTLKTAYFRVRLIGDVSGDYVAKITAGANMSAMWKKADSLVKLMTDDQKNTFLYAWTQVNDLKWFGSDDFKLSDGTNIVGFRSADGPNGIRFPVTGVPNDIAIFGSGNPATVFATEAARGCTWDTAMAIKVGQAIGREARAMGLFCNLGPMSDLVTNPRWGRAFETFGEDPYLVGKMAASQVKGLQSVKVIATPKHFAPYCKEDARQAGLRIHLSEQALRELFCVPFEMGIKEGGARAIMTCYNKLMVPGFSTESAAELTNNCDRAGTNRHLIQDILRNDWGFDGIIMTDWLGSDGTPANYAFNTDFDMDMPVGISFEMAATNIRNGLAGWTVDKLNKKALNVMYAKLWAWDGKLLPNDDAIKTFPQSAILSQDNLNLTLDEARESIVLVKNDAVDGKPVLPLDKSVAIKVAVVGPYANMYRPGGGGSSAVTPDSQISPLTGITRYLTKTGSPITLITDAANIAGADVAIVFVGVDKEQEGNDRPAMTLPTSPVDQPALVTSVMAKVKKTIVVYTGGSASTEGSWSSAPGVVVAFYPGRNQAQALAEMLFGDVNPSGHLCVTFPKTPGDLPAYDATDQQLYYTSADSAHGYFYFEKTKKTPLFWFGHGLSYTSFTYQGINVMGPTTVSKGERFDVRVYVSNSGLRAGSDVVQLYVKPVNSSVPRRVKDLRGFSRVTITPGETQTVTFTLGARDFSIYDANPTTKTGGWKVVPGTYELIAASTSNPAELINGNGQCASTSITIQ